MKYVVLLRGINISGKNKIAMCELKELLKNNNYKNVVTYLNSGNVILDSDDSKENVASNINTLIKRHFNLDIPVYVITYHELGDILKNSPSFLKENKKEIYNNIIFIFPDLNFLEIKECIGEFDYNIDRIENYNNVIFWSFDLNNYRKSIWWKGTAKYYIKDKITIRTLNTVRKLYELCGK